MNTVAIPLRRKRDLDCKPYSEDDCDTLLLQLLEAGYVAHRSDVAWAWYQHSDARCATWLYAAGDEPQHNVHALLEYLEPTV